MRGKQGFRTRDRSLERPPTPALVCLSEAFSSVRLIPVLPIFLLACAVGPTTSDRREPAPGVSLPALPAQTKSLADMPWWELYRDARAERHHRDRAQGKPGPQTGRGPRAGSTGPGRAPPTPTSSPRSTGLSVRARSREHQRRARVRRERGVLPDESWSVLHRRGVALLGDRFLSARSPLVPGGQGGSAGLGGGAARRHRLPREPGGLLLVQLLQPRRAAADHDEHDPVRRGCPSSSSGRR